MVVKGEKKKFLSIGPQYVGDYKIHRLNKLARMGVM